MKLFDWILRGLIIGGLAILFLPVIRLPQPASRPRLILLVDASFSMNNSDKQSQYRKLLEELHALGARLTIKTYIFSDSLSRTVNPQEVKFNGPSTDIYNALKSLNTQDADAILMVSDGRHNGPEGLENKLVSIPLWTLALGEKNLSDIGIEEVQQEDSAQLRVRLRSNLDKEELVELNLYRKSRNIASRKVSLASDGLTELTINLQDKDIENGLRLELDTLPGEDRTDNNTFIFNPPPKSRELNVLFVAGRLSKETELILGTLRNLPHVSLSFRVEIAPGMLTEERNGKIDVLVVGPLGKNASNQILDVIQNSVAKKIPVLFIASAQEIPNNLKSLLPLEESTRQVNPDIPWRYSPFGELLMAGWEPLLETTKGIAYSAKPQADVLLAKGDAAFIAKRSEPVRIIEVEIPDLANVARLNRPGFERFIARTLGYLAEGDGFPFGYQIDESNDASLKLTLFSQIEINAEEIQAWLEPDSHRLNVVPLSSSMLRLTGTPPQGKYSLDVAWRGQRFTPGGEIEVTPASPEKASRGANQELLKHLATRNSGELISLDDMERLTKSLPERNTFNFKPLQTPWIVILVAICLLVEIWYRRKIGLP